MNPPPKPTNGPPPAPRPLRDDDRPALATLFEASEWRAEAESVREGRDGLRQPDDLQIRWGVEGDGLVGTARLLREAGEFSARLLVRPDAREKGVGRALWNTLLAEAHTQGATKLSASVRDDDPASLAFATRRGFAQIGHLFESVLDLETFDPRAFPTPEGVRVFSMADVSDDETNRRKLWRLNDWDIDAGRGACRDFERFQRDIFEGYWYRPEGQIVAAMGEAWVGLAAVGMTGEGKGYNMMTGVVPAFRGRGIATALKLATVEFARRAGAREIWTNNDSENAPMLAINRRLGYRPVPGWLRLEAPLNPTEPRPAPPRP